MKQARKLDPANIEIRRAHAALLVECERWDEALAAWKKIPGVDAEYAWGHYYLARIHEAKGRLRRAIRAASRAIFHDPGLGDAYRLRGELYEAIGKPERAKADAVEADRLDPLT